MAKKQFKINLPDYLTVGMYQRISEFDGTEINKLVNIISTLLKLDKDVVKSYPVQLLTSIAKDMEELALPKESFHALVEFNGTLYGYSDIHKMNLGCFVDMEEYSKDITPNLHKIASLIYRPVTKNRFKSLDYVVKQGIRTARKKGVENPFEYYEIEDYDSDVVKDRWDEMKDFPSHILLGALSFFLTVASMYSNDIAYSKQTMTKKMKKMLDTQMKQVVLMLTGDGGRPFIDYLKPVSFQSQEIVV